MLLVSTHAVLQAQGLHCSFARPLPTDDPGFTLATLRAMQPRKALAERLLLTSALRADEHQKVFKPATAGRRPHSLAWQTRHWARSSAHPHSQGPAGDALTVPLENVGHAAARPCGRHSTAMAQCSARVFVKPYPSSSPMLAKPPLGPAAGTAAPLPSTEATADALDRIACSRRSMRTCAAAEADIIIRVRFHRASGSSPSESYDHNGGVNARVCTRKCRLPYMSYCRFPKLLGNSLLTNTQSCRQTLARPLLTERLVSASSLHKRLCKGGGNAFNM